MQRASYTPTRIGWLYLVTNHLASTFDHLQNTSNLAIEASSCRYHLYHIFAQVYLCTTGIHRLTFELTFIGLGVFADRQYPHIPSYVQGPNACLLYRNSALTEFLRVLPQRQICIATFNLTNTPHSLVV